VTLIILIGGLALFLWHSASANLAVARTVIVNLFVLVEVFYLFNCRSLNRSALNQGLFGNRLAVFGAMAMVGLQLFFTYSPWMNHLFHTAPLRAESWLGIIVVALVAFVAVELEKWIRFGGRQGKHAPPE
jgi:magnesium-transporting ATPase (P-type)